MATEQTTEGFDPRLVAVPDGQILDPELTETMFEPTDGESGVDFITRLASSFAVTDKGRNRIIESRLPQGHHLVSTKQGMAIADPDGNVRLVDPFSLELADIFADPVGDIPEIGLSTAAGTATALATFPAGPVVSGPSTVIAGGAGSALGRITRQTIANMLGANENYGTGSQQAFLEGAYGEMIPAGGMVALRGLQRFPVNPVAKWFKSIGAETDPIAKNLAKDLGIPESKLKPGMITESPYVRFGEARLGQHPVTADMYTKEIDRPFIQALHNTLSNVRKSFGMGLRKTKRGLGLEWPIKSNIDIDRFSGNLVRQVENTRAMTKDLADTAWNEFVQSAPQGGQTPVMMTNLLNYISTYGQKSAKFRRSQKGVLKNLIDLADDVQNVENLADLDNLRSILGEQIYEKDMYGRHGSQLYRAIMDDLDDNIAQWGTPSEAYQLYRNLWRRQHTLNQSGLVKKIFGRSMDIDEELLDDAAVKVFRSGSKEAIRRFRQAIGADTFFPEQAKTMHHLRGQFVWDQMKQLFIDRVLLESFTQAAEGRGMKFAGTMFTKKLFREIGEDNLNELFGREATQQLKKLGQLLNIEGVSDRMYQNFSNTAMHNDLAGLYAILTPIRWLRNVSKLKGEQIVGKQLVKTQEEGALLGREYFTEGRSPNLAAWAHKKGGTRPFENLLKRLGYRGPQLRTIIRAISQTGTHLSGDVVDTTFDAARLVTGVDPNRILRGGRPQR